jgi:hypothetical protein
MTVVGAMDDVTGAVRVLRGKLGERLLTPDQPGALQPDRTGASRR